MHLDRSRRDHQIARDLLGREALVQQAQDVPFALDLGFQALLPQ